jgi:hypothetical protein
MAGTSTFIRERGRNRHRVSHQLIHQPAQTTARSPSCRTRAAISGQGSPGICGRLTAGACRPSPDRRLEYRSRSGYKKGTRGDSTTSISRKRSPSRPPAQTRQVKEGDRFLLIGPRLTSASGSDVHSRGAGAGTVGIAKVAARTGIPGGGQDKKHRNQSMPTTVELVVPLKTGAP